MQDGKKCAHCGLIYGTGSQVHGKFCSTECRNAYANDRKELKKVCLNCRNLFANSDSNYCSKACQLAANCQKLKSEGNQNGNVFSFLVYTINHAKQLPANELPAFLQYLRTEIL